MAYDQKLAGRIIDDQAREIERLRADNERVQTARRASLAIADERSRENVALRADNARLRKCRDELVYIVRYFQGGIRPTDLDVWWRRSCDALQSVEQTADVSAADKR